MLVMKALCARDGAEEAEDLGLDLEWDAQSRGDDVAGEGESRDRPCAIHAGVSSESPERCRGRLRLIRRMREEDLPHETCGEAESGL